MFWLLTEIGSFVSGLLGLFLNYIGQQIAFFVMAVVLVICLIITLVSFEEQPASAVVEPTTYFPRKNLRSGGTNSGSRSPSPSPTRSPLETNQSNETRSNPSLEENNNNDAENRINLQTQKSSCLQCCEAVGCAHTYRQICWPFKRMDFVVILFTTFFLAALESIVSWFIFFYLRDIVQNFDLFGSITLDNPETATSVWVLTTTAGAVIGALSSNWATSQIGYKLVVLLGAFCAALTPICYMFLEQYETVVFLAILFGAGVSWTNSGYVLLLLFVYGEIYICFCFAEYAWQAHKIFLIPASPHTSHAQIFFFSSPSFQLASYS